MNSSRELIGKYSIDLRRNKKKIEILTSQEEHNAGLNIQQSIEVINPEPFEFKIINEYIFRKNVHTLMTHNVLYVIRMANIYKSKTSIDLNDLIQAGNLGLYDAAIRFDPTRGLKFITYAHTWIKQSIIKEIVDNSRTVAIPPNIQNDKQKITKVQNKLFATYGYFSPFELQYGNRSFVKDEKTGQIKEINNYGSDELENKDVIEGTGIINDIIDKIKHVGSISSFDHPLNEEEVGTVIDVFIPPAGQRNDKKPDDIDHTKFLCCGFLNKLSNSSHREILKCHFGIDCEYPMSTESIAERFKMTTANVNNIIKKSLMFLRQFFQNNKDKIVR